MSDLYQLLELEFQFNEETLDEDVRIISEKLGFFFFNFYEQNKITNFVITTKPKTNLINTSPQSFYLIKDEVLDYLKFKLSELITDEILFNEILSQMCFSLSFGKFSRNTLNQPNQTYEEKIFAINSMIKLYREQKWMDPKKKKK